MSRLIIKNLPPYISTEQLRSHFETLDGKGAPVGATITDAKVATQQAGKSRRFGFVGYKSEAEAQAAKAWFHKTFIGTSKIDVDIVEANRPKKRPRLSGPEKDEYRPDNVVKKTPSQHSSSQFQEYTALGGQKRPGWANEATSHPIIDLTQAVGETKEAETTQKEMESDMDWMRRRMNANVEDSTFQQPEEDIQKRSSIMKQTPAVLLDQAIEDPDLGKDETVMSAQDMIRRTCRLFLRNLAYSCLEEDLQKHFAPFGTISQVIPISYKRLDMMYKKIGTSDSSSEIHIPVEASTKQPKGTAYISYQNPESAVLAFEKLDRTVFQGRLLHIIAAVDRRPKAAPNGVEVSRSVKGEREAKQKADAGKAFNWGMLYMSPDAVASSIADRMNISKADILNPESDNAAVKLALAETHVIAETKAYLSSHGLIISAFDDIGRKRRSDTTILVKNIPYGTTEDVVKELFEPFGQLERVLVPPSGTMAVVEFLNSNEAKDAFKGIAYRRVGNSVVYLEWSPTGMFSDINDGDAKMEGAQPVVITDSITDEPPLSAGSTLFIKNLAFATTKERLTSVFGSQSEFSFARVQTKPDPNRHGAKLSLGYGFVGFKTKQAAADAMKGMQGYVLDGHALIVKFAGRNADELEASSSSRQGKVATSKTTTKMVVKNVPFEATKNDIRELFSAHGHMKSLRLPKKFDSRSRGFAFLEFVTRQEAENAYNALQHTHLLGRHLVLEWASAEDEDVDMLRRKAGVGLGNGEEMPGRKRKIDMTAGESRDDNDLS